MNRSEQRIVSILPLPNTGEKDLLKIILQYNNAIQDLYKKDSDKEQRIRALEAKQDKGSAKYAKEKFHGRHWKFVEPDNDTGIPLQVYYSADGQSWPSEPVFTFEP